MHGEYKAPGGKLVVADVSIDDHRLSSVSISGDFFLEPDSALDAINSSLRGMKEDATVDDLARAVSSALDQSVVLLGISPQAVGIAVRRALGKATRWEDHTFEVIDALTLDAAQHVALDEVIAASVAAGERGPTLRLWDWKDSVVVIGSFQSVRNEIDQDGASRYGVGIVRRISGGGAMFMEPGNCITYSLVVPASLVEGLSLEQSYAFLDDWVLGALGDVGIKARYVPLNDIASDLGKIGGAAQKRFVSGVVLHHVTMAYDINASRMLEVLRIGREKISDKGIASANKRVDPMRSQTGMARRDIMRSLLAHFRQRYATRAGEYTSVELERAEALMKEKYLSHDWTHRVP